MPAKYNPNCKDERVPELFTDKKNSSVLDKRKRQTVTAEAFGEDYDFFSKSAVSAITFFAKWLTGFFAKTS